MPQSFKSLARLIAGLAVVFVIVSASAFQLVNHTNGRMLSAGVEREYHVHIPESYDPATPAALVIALHGYGQLPIQQNDLTHWSDLADEEGFIVVYPGGTYFPLRWQTGGVYEGISDPRSDIAFVSDLIDAMERQYNIDPARIYASGLSNGAGTSFILSCTLSERIAAVGLAAGAYLYPWTSASRSAPCQRSCSTGPPMNASPTTVAEPASSACSSRPFHAGWTLWRRTTAAMENRTNGNCPPLSPKLTMPAARRTWCSTPSRVEATCGLAASAIPAWELAVPTQRSMRPEPCGPSSRITPYRRRASRAAFTEPAPTRWRG